MAGIYLHIPYCKQACSYCNFHFSTQLGTHDVMIEAMIRQIYKDNFLIEKEINTIYFGGGTPSLVTPSSIERLLQTIYANYTVADQAEITLEANPDDVNKSNLDAWKRMGINRFSLGVQSFYDEDLKFMNRAHNATEALQCIKMIQDAGFEDISIDLIYGSPTTTIEMWESNVQKALELGVPHISSYCLTVEPKTALAHSVKSLKVTIDENLAAQQFDYLVAALTTTGFHHYEISNFAKPDRYAKHNTAYWQNKSYLGIGPAAHAYNGKYIRRWNVSNNANYISGISQGDTTWYESESLTLADVHNEYIMTRLRTMWGIELSYFKEKFGQELLLKLLDKIRNHRQVHFFEISEHTIILKPEGKFFADGLASDLFE